MQYSNFDFLGRPVSRLVMGTAGIAQLQDYSVVTSMLDRFIEAGGNVLDTAHQYAGSEVVLGRWLSERNKREQVIILTKGAHHDDGEPGARVNPKAITKDLTESLERLKTDYIDLYALHRDDPTVGVGPIVEVLNQHIEDKKIRSFGASNWTYQRIELANEYAYKHGLVGFSFSSTNLSLARANEPRWPGCVSADDETLKWHESNQMPLISWSSQAGGFFSGRFSPADPSNEEIVRVFYSQENWEKYRRAEFIAKSRGLTAIQIALAYVLNQNFPTCAIVGCETLDELSSSIAGASAVLTSEELEWLNLRSSTLSP